MHDDPPSLTPDARRAANRLLEVLERERRLESLRRDSVASHPRHHTAPTVGEQAPETPRSD